MAIRRIEISNTPGLHDAPAHRVYTREFWAEDWELVPNLYCDYLTFAASPDLPEAQLSYRYGEICQAADVAFSNVAALDLLRQYVKIAIDAEDSPTSEAITWHGTIEEVVDDRGGLIPLPANSIEAAPTGAQQFRAYGLELQLDRVTVTDAYIDDNGAETHLLRGLEFNGPPQNQLGAGQNKTFTRNRTPTKGTRNAYLFASDPTTAAAWSTAAIAEYLLQYHSPGDGSNTIQLPFMLSLDAASIVATWDNPIVKTQGRTVRAILNEIFDRRRGTAYRVIVLPDGSDDGAGNPVDGDTAAVVPFSFASSTLTYADQSLPANADQIALAFDHAADLEAATLHTDKSQTFDQVVCAGQRPLVCFTISALDDTLVEQWTSDQQTDYNAGASTAADYAALDKAEKQIRNDDARASERFKRVYSYFGLPSDWDGMVGDGVGGSKNPFYQDPDASDDESDTTPQPVYLPELRFEKHLPLRTDHDYSDAGIVSGNPTDAGPDRALWEYLPLFGAIKLADANRSNSRGTGDDTIDYYQYLDRMAVGAFNELAGEGNGRDFCASIRPQDYAAGVVLEVQGGFQYEIASEDFVSPDGIDDFQGQYNWRDNLLCTVAVQADSFAEGVYPSNPLPSGGPDVVRILRVEVDDANLHIIAAGTVVGIKDGELQRQTSTVTILDDRFRLQALARFAFEWYGRQRVALELGIRRVLYDVQVGQLVSSIGAADEVALTDINTPITKIRYEFPASIGSKPAAPKTTFSTAFSELDLARLHYQ